MVMISCLAGNSPYKLVLTRGSKGEEGGNKLMAKSMKQCRHKHMQLNFQVHNLKKHVKNVQLKGML